MTKAQASEGVADVGTTSPPSGGGDPFAGLSCDPNVMEEEARTGSSLLERPSDPWLWRRSWHFGASEVAALLIALGRRPEDAFGSYPARASKTLLKRKAGLRKPLKRPPEADRGKELEPELFRQWHTALLRGTATTGYAPMIDAESACYVEGLPPALRCLSPAVDHECPELSASLDVACFDVLGRLGVVDLKCSRDSYLAPPATAHMQSDEREARTLARMTVQLHAQMAVTGAAWGTIVEGVRWCNDWAADHGRSQPVYTHDVFERNEALIEEIRDACREGWRRVEELRREAA